MRVHNTNKQYTGVLIHIGLLSRLLNLTSFIYESINTTLSYNCNNIPIGLSNLISLR
jgi:hypothetical protein